MDKRTYLHNTFAWIYMKFYGNHTHKSLLLNIVFMCVHWSVLNKGIILSFPHILSHFIQHSNEIDRIIGPFDS